MPSLITHYIHSNEVLKKLDDKSKDIINKNINIYNISSQSHDILFYSTNKYIKDLGHKAHHNNTQDFILNIIKYIKDNNLENNTELISYLYGIINHYVLDTTTHPYIFYLSGSYHKENKNSHKYKGLHTKIEKDIDSLYYQKYFNKEYKTCNLKKEIIKSPLPSKYLLNLIDNIYLKTYNIPNIGKYYLKSLNRIKRIINPLSKDILGIKYCIYNLIDILSNNSLSSYSTYHKPTNYLNYNTWYHPVTNEEQKNNFNELFDLSITKSIDIINKINEVLYDNKNIETLKDIIPNIDYSTGLDIKNNKQMKYFIN